MNFGILGTVFKALELYEKDGAAIKGGAIALIDVLKQLHIIKGDDLTLGDVNSTIKDHGVDPSKIHTSLPAQKPEGPGLGVNI